MTAPLQDKRVSTRRRMLKAGRISFNGGGSTIDCLLRNISETGALLKVTTPLGIPDQFDLVLVESEQRFRCRVVRRSAQAVGVTFNSERD